jgi:tetratricopeptide (TPR) repeat protein
MRNEKLIENIQNPMNIGKAEIADMRISLQAFPYFTSMQLLYAKGLYNTDSISYNSQLRKAAAYVGNRKLLFKLITENVKVAEEIIEKPTAEKEMVKIEQKPETATPEKELEIGKPLEFTENETHSFAEWLALTKAKKIDRKQQSSENLIDKFIEQEPRISKPKREEFFSPVQSAEQSLIENDEIVTETLARVYLEQEHFDKAISAYEKLSLKYPQKNSFFANQIKLIYDLKQK